MVVIHHILQQDQNSSKCRTTSDNDVTPGYIIIQPIQIRGKPMDPALLLLKQPVGHCIRGYVYLFNDGPFDVICRVCTITKMCN